MDLNITDIGLDSRGDIALDATTGIKIVGGLDLVIQNLRMMLRSEPGDLRLSPAFGFGLKDYAAFPNSRELAEILIEDLTDSFYSLTGTEGFTIVPDIYPTGPRQIRLELGIADPTGKGIQFNVNVDLKEGVMVGFGQPDIRPIDVFDATFELTNELIKPSSNTRTWTLTRKPQLAGQVKVYKKADITDANFNPNGSIQGVTPFDVAHTINNKELDANPYAIRPYMRNFINYEAQFNEILRSGEEYIINYVSTRTI